MAHVTQVLARVFVDDIDAALTTYQRLAGVTDARRFAFRDVQLAWVGPFLLLHLPDEERARYERSATLLVDDIDQVREIVVSEGGEVLERPAPAPNGPRMIARHADGAVFEYIQPTPTT